MHSNNYHFEIQVAKATNGQKNGSAEESTSDLKTPTQSFQTIYLFDRFQHKVKECVLYVIASYGLN